MVPLWLKRDYKAISFTLLSCVCGLILMRIILQYCGLPSDTYGQSLVRDTVFTLCTQIVFFLTVPFIIYKFYGKRTVKQTLAYSGLGKFKPYYLLALPLGIAAYYITVGISSTWAELLRVTGYTYSSSSPELPEKFVFGFFITDIILTAVLPAVCEEFAMRGGLLSTLQNSFKTVGCVIICGVAFGLFHQNIKQVFYTALFGALAAYMTIRTKSLYPAMIMHFTNNFCSVFINYADSYHWAMGGGFYSGLAALPSYAVALIFLAVTAFGAAILLLMLYIRDKLAIDKKTEVLKDCAFDATNKRVVLFGEFDEQRVKDLEMEKEVYGKDYREERYKPRLRDLAIIIALGVATLLTTVFTYVWGFFY